MPTGGEGGGGGGSSDVRAGGAFVEIYGKDKLTAQLEGIKSRAGGVMSGIQKISGSVIGALGIGLGVGKTVVELASATTHKPPCMGRSFCLTFGFYPI